LSENESSLGRWISILYRYRQNFLNKRLDPYSIGSGQHLFLLVLARNDGINQEELSDHVKIDKATTAKAVKKLEDAGYVERVVDRADKRAYQVFLTPKAWEIIPVIQAAVREWEVLLTRGLPENESVMAEEILEKMAHNACQLKSGRKGEQ
jgi:DNA-binding MarR family transcriptional regulator